LIRKRKALMQDVVLITGATAGIGAACARRFARGGAALVLIGRRADRLQAMQAELGAGCVVIAADVADRAAIEAGIAALPASHREVSVLINNAGLALGPSPALQGTVEDWDRMIDTNIKGLLYVTRAVLPGMVARNHGHVLNIGSIGGNYVGGSTVYGGTKAFVHHLSLMFRAELLGKAVRITSVEPGSTDTEFALVRSRGDQAQAEAAGRGYKKMSAEDVAEAIWMCHALPAHVNVNRIELTPVAQGFAPITIARDPA